MLIALPRKNSTIQSNVLIVNVSVWTAWSLNSTKHIDVKIYALIHV